MRKKMFSLLSAVTICCLIVTGCGEKDIKGKSGDRSFSTNFYGKQIYMVNVRGYDEVTYNANHTFTGCYTLAGTNDCELQFGDSDFDYTISTNKNIKDNPKKLKVYYDAYKTNADIYSISNLSSC